MKFKLQKKYLLNSIQAVSNAISSERNSDLNRNENRCNTN